MKNLLFGLLALGTISAFAQESIIITNKTYPNENLEIKCSDVICENLNFIFTRVDGSVKTKTMTKKVLVAVSDSKLTLHRYQQQGDEVADYFPYGMTKADLVGDFYGNNTIGRDWVEGEEVKAVGRSLLLPVRIALDTVLLPYSLINYISNLEGRQKRHTVRKLLRKIENGESVEIKEKRFTKLVKVIF